ncbi:glycosyltransferase [Sporosarcina sp. Marseille-Q4943]|uniref:glycosyltransferase n=1 Tax=Sporosarcina sp. Marseille-Q4943 TaxID=2942204 RepID=UPI00208DB86B|nr:glycosyltransferase [Sporosarcina sp. Marseille-Q4943]
MKLLFVHSHVFKYDENNNFYSDGKLTYEMWKQRYLKYFTKMIVAGRGREIGEETLNISSGPSVEHFILPDLSKIKSRFQNLKVLKADLELLMNNTDVLIARMPSGHAYHAIKIARKLNKPYVIEVVGDVYAALWSHGNYLGKILAPISYVKYKRIIKQSSNLIYVTESYLQDKYPYKRGANTTNISNVDIKMVSEEILEKRINRINKMDVNKNVSIGLIGSYSSKYKGIDTAIRAVKNLNELGFNCTLIVLGDGNNRWLKEISKKLDIENKIVFAGSLPGGEKVFEWLDTLDLYIQPSLTEGLPRALIEAMSRGLPCVASEVGGIPELINRNFIHKPKSAKELSEKIELLLKNKTLMLNQAEKNYLRAKEYTADVLNDRRECFWVEFIDREINRK